MRRQLVLVGLLICQLQLIQGYLINGNLACPDSDKWNCPGKTKHLGCKLTKEFDGHCGPLKAVKKARIIKIDGNLKHSVLAYINALRDIKASGLKGWKAATKMQALEWDDYLEAISTQMAYRCSDAYNYCGNSPQYPVVTTTVIRILSRKNNIHDTILKKFLPVWFADLNGCRMNQANQIVRSEKSGCVGHYIPLMTDNIYQMGCAASSIGPTDGLYNISMVCNFSKKIYTPVLYSVGTNADGCKTSKDFIHKFLCASPPKMENCSSNKTVNKIVD